MGGCDRIEPSVAQLHLDMQDNQLYGEVVVKYERGKAVLLKRTETIKPASQRDSRESEEQRDV